MAEKVGIEPEKPRVARRQAHRSNNPSTSVEEHYRVNAAIPFLDHVIENLNNKFDSENYFFNSTFTVFVLVLVYF